MQDYNKRLMKGTALEFMDNINAGFSNADKKLLERFEKSIIEFALKTDEGKKLKAKGIENPDTFEELLRIGISCAPSDQVEYWKKTLFHALSVKLPK